MLPCLPQIVGLLVLLLLAVAGELMAIFVLLSALCATLSGKQTADYAIYQAWTAAGMVESLHKLIRIILGEIGSAINARLFTHILLMDNTDPYLRVGNFLEEVGLVGALRSFTIVHVEPRLSAAIWEHSWKVGV